MSSNSLAEVTSAFWNATRMILADIIKDNPDRWIRVSYPKGGAPDWKNGENIVFLNLRARDDDYGRQRDSIYKNTSGTTMKHTMRTRVWDLELACYGDSAYAMATAMQDGVFLEDVRKYLSKKGIFLVPLMPIPIQSNEIFAGQWWERWNITLTFNEEYETSEDVGYIASVSIHAEALR